MTKYECQECDDFATLVMHNAAMHLKEEHSDIDNAEWKVSDAINEFMEVTE